MIVVNVSLIPGTNQSEFVESFSDNSSVKLKNLLEFLPNLLVMCVEESYIETLESDSRVLCIDIEQMPYPESIGYALPQSSTQSGEVTAETPLSVLDNDNAPGANYMPLSLYADTDVMPEPEQVVGNTDTNPDGDDVENLEDVDYTSMFFGENVDIVAIESEGQSFLQYVSANPPYNLDRYHTGPHPDFADPDDATTSRFVRTTWPGAPDVQAGRQAPWDWDPNEQQANQTNVPFFREDNWLTFHAIGSLSVAGGTIAGFAKKANLHVNYTWQRQQFISDTPWGSTVLESINNVVSWHNAKQNNSETGVPNPTVMTLNFGFSINKEFICPVERIGSITHNGVTTNRPANGWGDDLTPFTDNNITPFRFDLDETNENGDWTWAVTWSRSESTALKDAMEAAWDAGICVVNSAGNQCATYVKRDDPAYSNSTMFISPNENYYKLDYGSNSVLDQYIVRGSGSLGTTVYPFRSYGPHGCKRDKSIDVGAVQNSMKNSILDRYTNRGEGVDIMGRGEDTYSSYPMQGTTFSDGEWGYFSGTSAAASNIAGIAACEMSKYYYNTGRWPTPNQVKDILVNQSQNKIKELEGGSILSDVLATGIDLTGKSFSDMPPATGGTGWFTNSHHYYRTEMDFYNDRYRNLLQSHINQQYGKHNSLDLMGTTAKIGFFNAKGFDRSQSQGRRPREGGIYPRPKIRRD